MSVVWWNTIRLETKLGFGNKKAFQFCLEGFFIECIENYLVTITLALQTLFSLFPKRK